MTPTDTRVADLLAENHALHRALKRSDEQITRQANRLGWTLAFMVLLACVAMIEFLMLRRG